MTPVDLHSQVDIAHWSWTIAWFLWFVGIAGMGSVAYYFLRTRPLAIVILASLVLGLALVFSHLGRWWNMPMVMWTMITEGHFNFGSWMMIGVAALSVHLAFAAVILVAHLPGHGAGFRRPERPGQLGQRDAEIEAQPPAARVHRR